MNGVLDLIQTPFAYLGSPVISAVSSNADDSKSYQPELTKLQTITELALKPAQYQRLCRWNAQCLSIGGSYRR